MALFVSLFFLVYGSMHVVVLRALFRAMSGFYARTGLLIAGWCVLMVSAPLLVRVFDLRGWTLARSAVATVGYLWMAWIFLATVALLASDLLSVAAAGIDCILKTNLHSYYPSPRILFGVVAGGCLLLVAWGAVEARSLRLIPIVVTGNAAMPATRFRIAHVSDVHLGPVSPGRILERIERLLDEASPDLVVFTGDVVDGMMDGRNGDLEALSRIASRYPTFAVTGNHETIAGLAQSVEFLRSAGIRVLRNEAVSPAPWLRIVGVDDPSTGSFSDLRERRLLDEADGAFTILLKHRPSLSPLSAGRFDLQLSGHTHGGQIFPFSLITERVNGFSAGVHRRNGRGAIVVSRGAGTWGPPVRLLAPPEVPMIEIVHP